MKQHTSNYMSLIKTVSNHVLPRVLFTILVGGSYLPLQAEDRFAAPNLNAAANTFDIRFTTNSFNVEFLVSHVLNNARQYERFGKEVGNNVNENTSYITDTLNSIEGAVSNSVIVPPGTGADTIIVINMNEGDSFAIQR